MRTSRADERHPEQSPPAVGWQEVLADGTPVRIRPIGRRDSEVEGAFLRRLSKRALHDRFVGVVYPPSSAVARHLTDIKGDQVSLIALVRRGRHDVEVGAGGYFREHGGEHCHAAIAVDDAWRKRGVGTLLARHLIDLARASGVRRAFVVDPLGGDGHHRLAERLGFRRRPDPEDPASIVYELEL